VFRDSLNYIHIARSTKGEGSDETAGIDYTWRYGNSWLTDRPTAQSSGGYYRLVGSMGRPCLVTGGTASACCPRQLPVRGSPCVRPSAVKCSYVYKVYKVYKRGRWEDVLQSARQWAVYVSNTCLHKRLFYDRQM